MPGGEASFVTCNSGGLSPKTRGTEKAYGEQAVDEIKPNQVKTLEDIHVSPEWHKRLS